MSIPDWATTISGAAVVGGIILTVLKLWLRSLHEDTKQLQHNGGSHVADYAKDARDAARDAVAAVQKLSDVLTAFRIDVARKEGEQDAKLGVLMAPRAP